MYLNFKAKRIGYPKSNGEFFFDGIGYWDEFHFVGKVPEDCDVGSLFMEDGSLFIITQVYEEGCGYDFVVIDSDLCYNFNEGECYSWDDVDEEEMEDMETAELNHIISPDFEIPWSILRYLSNSDEYLNAIRKECHWGEAFAPKAIVEYREATENKPATEKENATVNKNTNPIQNMFGGNSDSGPMGNMFQMLMLSKIMGGDGFDIGKLFDI